MSSLPSTDHETARNVALGIWCAHCYHAFTKGHGSPTACYYCFRRLSANDRKDTPLAVHPEASVEARKQLARQRRKEKEHRGR